jgi:hypothetical protein
MPRCTEWSSSPSTNKSKSLISRAPPYRSTVGINFAQAIQRRQTIWVNPDLDDVKSPVDPDRVHQLRKLSAAIPVCLILQTYPEFISYEHDPSAPAPRRQGSWQIRLLTVSIHNVDMRVWHGRSRDPDPSSALHRTRQRIDRNRRYGPNLGEMR